MLKSTRSTPGIGRSMGTSGGNGRDDLGFATAYVPRDSDVFIALFGSPAADKKSFINSCCQSALGTSAPLHVVTVYPCASFSNITLYLVDIPCFSEGGEDDEIDAEVLHEIAKWLVKASQAGIMLTSIIHLQSISDPDIVVSFTHLLKMLKSLCGPEILNIGMFATTNWDRVSDDERARYEKLFIARVSKVEGMGEIKREPVICVSDSGSAIRLLQKVHLEKTTKLRLQHQMMIEEKPLYQTDCGREVYDSLAQHLWSRKEELRVSRRRLRSAIQSRKTDDMQSLQWEIASSTVSVHRLEYCIELLKLKAETRSEEDTTNEVTSNVQMATSEVCLTQGENEDDRVGETVLHLYAKHGDLARVQEELKKDAKLDAKDGLGCTALHYAAMQGHVEVVWCLLKQGGSTETKNIQGITPLAGAAHRGHEAIVQILLDHGVEIEAKDNSGWTALHCAAQFDHQGVVRLLLNKGADLEARDDSGQSALHLAAMKLDMSMARMLVDAGANINAIDNQGRTPKSLAKGNGHAEMATFLQQNIAQEIDSEEDSLASSEMSSVEYRS